MWDDARRLSSLSQLTTTAGHHLFAFVAINVADGIKPTTTYQPHHLTRYIRSQLVVVVVVTTSPSGRCQCGGRGQMPRRDQEYHQALTVLEHICDVNGVTKVMLAFCCLFWTNVYGIEWPILCWCAVKKLLTHLLHKISNMFSCLLPTTTMRTDWRRNVANESLVQSCLFSLYWWIVVCAGRGTEETTVRAQSVSTSSDSLFEASESVLFTEL